jgi:hypothetical protein
MTVIAMGSRWDPQGISLLSEDPIRGRDYSHVITLDDYPESNFTNETILIVDEEGYNSGAGLAKELFDDDNELLYVTSDAQPHSSLQQTLEWKPVYT